MQNFPARYEELEQQMARIGQAIPGTMQGFSAMHKAGVADGALSAKTKELIALGIAITVRCDGCIAYHVHDALKAGAVEDEIMETIGVAILMGGGPSVVYGCDAVEALRQFSEAVPA